MYAHGLSSVKAGMTGRDSRLALTGVAVEKGTKSVISAPAVNEHSNNLRANFVGEIP
jgi:hypothetical protein